MDPRRNDGTPGELEHRLRSMLLQSDRSMTPPSEPVSSQPAPDHHDSSWQGQHTGTKRPVRGGPKTTRRGYVKLDLTPEPVQPQSDGMFNPGHRGARSTSSIAGDSPHMQILSRPYRGHASGGRPQSTSSPRGFHRHTPSRFSSSRPPSFTPEQIRLQSLHLEELAKLVLETAEMSPSEMHRKETFRMRLEQACRETLSLHFAGQFESARLLPFGSVHSGFALPNSDMDLAFVPSYTQHDMPKVLEKRLLELGYGARLLTRTRVPILKICESPTPQLHAALCEERQNYDNMTPEEQEKYLHPPLPEEESREASKKDGIDDSGQEITPADDTEEPSVQLKPTRPRRSSVSISESTTGQPPADETAETPTPEKQKKPETRRSRPWYREKRLGPLDFPKEGVGIQCDLNFSNSLGLHNTLLLRCYSRCDVRVQLMVLFVKKWAKLRKINSSYSGTLSSYGYVLMVLHYLVNVASPPVCPNLQLAYRSRNGSWRPPQARTPDNEDPYDPNVLCEGYDVRFWRDEAEIQAVAAQGRLTTNRQALGVLLRDFFHYYAQQGSDVVKGGFGWGFQVLSLRTAGGILTKQEKEWTGARTTIQDHREVRNRYLFAIEDPFETDHNVARTVTHNGIVAIRDEFRRAWRILSAVARETALEGSLFEPVLEEAPPPSAGAEEEHSSSSKVQDAPEESAAHVVDTVDATATAEENATPDGQGSRSGRGGRGNDAAYRRRRREPRANNHVHGKGDTRASFDNTRDTALATPP